MENGFEKKIYGVRLATCRVLEKFQNMVKAADGRVAEAQRRLTIYGGHS